MASVDVLLLTQQQCAYCDDAKALLERLAADYPLTLRTLDIATPEGRQLAARGGVMFPPGVLLDGEPFSYGRQSERKLRRALGRRLAPHGTIAATLWRRWPRSARATSPHRSTSSRQRSWR